MIRIFIFLLASFLLIINAYSNNNKLPSLQHLKVIKGIHKDNFVRIPPPDNFSLKSIALQKSDIKVEYNNFPDEAKAALEYAVGIWESLIHSEITIDITADWEELNKSDETTTLGGASSTDFKINNNTFPQSNVFYNIALAEKLSRSQLNTALSADIYMVFNSEASWYFGTDGETPSGKFDFVSVALHEICHGLGFQGSMSINAEGEGIWGYGSIHPFAFDQYVFNGANQQLINLDVFQNPSFELQKQMVSNDLYFDGPVLNSLYGSKARLYVPNPYEEGSSVNHLSRDFDNTTERLMTPGIQTGASYHNPGIITMAIMEELGWTSIYIEHEKLLSNETVSDIEVVASIFPDFETAISPLLHYSINNDSFQIKPLESVASDSIYSAFIEITESAEIEYYISVSDKYKRVFNFPNTAPENPVYLNIGADTISPEISHVANNYLYDHSELTLIAVVTDLYGIDSVYVEYSINGVEKQALLLKLNGENTYNISIDLSEYNLLEGDVFNYRLVAVDASASQNKAYLPFDGFYSMEVVDIPEYLETYESNFESGSNEFYLNGFDFTTPNGFNNASLNSEHPYQTGGEATWLDFTAELIFPIKIHNLYHYLAFDEIALIEPGAGNVAFNDTDFFDYVVVEGSKDNGITWFPFEDGWDCRIHEEWEETYTKSYNFDLIADLDLIKRHQIDLTHSDEFSVGDVVLIRFRLNTDPYEAGWGWMIDNLQIQTVGLSSKLTKISNFKVYPNPVKNGVINISGINDHIKRIQLYDSMGKMVYSQLFSEGNDKIFIPSYIKGLYILYIESENSIYTAKLQFL